MNTNYYSTQWIFKIYGAIKTIIYDNYTKQRSYIISNTLFTSGPAGIEPTTSDSESDIIPLNYGPIM